MNRNIIYIASLFLLVVVGCSKDLETAPTDAVDENEIYKNADNIETVINGTWKYLNETYATYANPGYSAVMRTSDAMGSDVALITTKYGYAGPYNFTDMFNETSSRTTFFWTLFYKVIDNMNNVVTKIDAADGDVDYKNRLKGQAKALRAFAYYNLVSFYQYTYAKDKNALAVPIYTEPTTVTTVPQARATVEQVYALIESDLKDALTLVGTYQGAKYKINSAIINGLLARTYLNTEKWELAAKHAADARKGYPLMEAAKYAEGFNDLANGEWIWGHPQTPEQSDESYTFHYMDVSSKEAYYSSFMADPYFKELFDEQDIRSQLFEWSGSSINKGWLKYKKFKFRSNMTGDIVYMRAAEMYLIEAEGLARGGHEGEAIDRLNELRGARNAKPYTSGRLVDAILIERRKELWGEGFSLTDILRTQVSVARKSYVKPDGTAIYVTVKNDDGKDESVEALGHTLLIFPDRTSFVPNSRYYLFAIPQSERDRNENL